MKKKLIIISIFIVFSILFNGCIDININTGEMIKKPENKLTPLKGIWEIAKYEIAESSVFPNEELNQFIGKKAEFDSKSASFADEICINPEYKVKNVNTSNYFLYTHRIDHKILGITSNKIDIISVTSDGKLFYDFIQINDKELIVYIDNTFFYLDKVSDKTSTQVSDVPTEQEDVINKKIDEESLLRSGVLIGLRSQLNSNEKDIINDNLEYTYKTLWIASTNRELHTLYENENLFVPRKSGFWNLMMLNSKYTEFYQDELYAEPIDDKSNISDMENIISDNSSKADSYGNSKDYINNKITNDIMISNEFNDSYKSNVFKKILFVGNDYVSIGYGYSDDKNQQKYDKLMVVPIDNLNSKKPIKISDIVGEKGEETFISTAKALMSQKNDNSIPQNKSLEESFGMTRRSGQWILFGRLNYNNFNKNYLDYNVNIIPPKEMVNYDMLHIPWNMVKESVPEAIDVFTSPNKDIAIIICKKEIYIYPIYNGFLASTPIQKIDIKEGDSVIMAEWAIGDYVEKWERLFSKKSKILIP